MVALVILFFLYSFFILYGSSSYTLKSMRLIFSQLLRTIPATAEEQNLKFSI